MSVQFEEDPNSAEYADFAKPKDVIVDFLIGIGVKNEKWANMLLLIVAGIGLAFTFFFGIKALRGPKLPSQAELIKQAQSYPPLPMPVPEL